MIDLDRIEQTTAAAQPYRWALVDGLFTREDAQALVASYPLDHFKTVSGYDGEKGFSYEARSLLHMGADAPSHAESLSPAWRRLAADLVSPEYRRAMTRLTGVDLTSVPVEANVFHYGPGAWLGPHVDLPDKIVTHVLYFNEAWHAQDGGCLMILRSADVHDAAAVVEPLVGSSSVLVRSNASWHAVSRVRDGCTRSRRSLTVTFYRPGAMSTMWPPGDATPLHRYLGHDGGASDPAARGQQEAAAFDAALREQERLERDARPATAGTASGAPSPEGTPGFASSVHPSEVKALLEFRAAVLHSKGWRLLQAARRLVGRAW